MADFVTARVILYKNGIGHFERRGLVNKEATIDLLFPTDAMNDILKSINVTSASSKETHTITYEVPSPTSPSTPLPPAATHKDLYSRLVRETVTIRTNDGKEISGMVVAVDLQGKTNSGIITLLTTPDNLLRTFELSTIATLRPPPSLTSHTKSLKIHVKSPEAQQFFVTYIRSCPIWKPTYRAILSNSSSEYRLCGWATVHNPGPDDWKGVSVSLVTGQPVSFVDKLYVPKYRERPTIHSSAKHTPLGISSLLASALNIESDSEDEEEEKNNTRTTIKKNKRVRDYSRSASRSDSGSRSRSRTPPGRTGPNVPMDEREDGDVGAAPGIPSTTTAESETVDLFRYDLSTPLDLTSGHSALVPLFDTPVSGRKISLFNPTLHHEHPFTSLVFSNTTGMTLEAGSITVFDGDMYIGEAHVINTKPNERRFLPFSLEKGVLLSSPLPTYNNEPVHQTTIKRGSITLVNKTVAKKQYVITNKTAKEIELILEHPKDLSRPQSTLVVDDCYVEKGKTKVDVRTEYVTAHYYGLNFKLHPNSITNLVLKGQSLSTQTLDLNFFGPERTKSTELPEELTTVLAPFWKLKKQEEELDRTANDLKKKVAELEKEQGRARSNVGAITDKAKQQRYLTQIDTSEDMIAVHTSSILGLSIQKSDVSAQLLALKNSLEYDSSTVSPMKV